MIEPLSASIAAAALALIVARPRHTGAVASAMLVVAVVSSLVTVEFARVDHPGWAGATLLELVALSLPITLLVRSARLSAGLIVSCAFAGVTEGALILRYTDLTLPLSVASMALWSLPAIGAAGAGLYLRALDAHRRQAVTDAARGQRIALARDLHDFVAHDVTALVVQAQAARAVADHDPQRVLERIEAAGLRALGAIDRTLQLLREDGETAPRGADLRSLAELTRRFSADGDTNVQLAADPQILHRLGTQAANAVHRLAIESLTNVRRHAPSATRVDVEITAGERQTVVLAVTNDSVTPVRSGRAAGTGLAHLADRVAALGGRLSAGPIDGQRWRVRAEFPAAR